MLQSGRLPWVEKTRTLGRAWKNGSGRSPTAMAICASPGCSVSELTQSPTHVDGRTADDEDGALVGGAVRLVAVADRAVDLALGQRARLVRHADQQVREGDRDAGLVLEGALDVEHAQLEAVAQERAEHAGRAGERLEVVVAEQPVDVEQHGRHVERGAESVHRQQPRRHADRGDDALDVAQGLGL